MPTPVILPKFDMTMEQGTITRWLRQEGERVQQGDPLVEVETDKVNMEVESPASGILAGIRAQPGQTIPVTRVIAYIIEPGEEIPADEAPSSPPAPRRAGAPPAAPPTQAVPAVRPPAVAAAPATRRLADELGVDLSAVTGTGPGGRITEADVRTAAEKVQAARVPLTRRRRLIAQRMAQSARTIPHIYLMRTVDMSAVSASRAGASYTAVVVWAAARALRGHRLLRASLEGEVITVYEAIHIGVAVETADGVIVPVIKDADRKDLQGLHGEIDALAGRARDGTLTPDEIAGGVFTVSNLGMFGLDRFTALIFPPQSALLAVGAVRRRAWVAGDTVAVRPVCELTLALDHRVADGAAGARFLDDLCRRLEGMNL